MRVLSIFLAFLVTTLSSSSAFAPIPMSTSTRTFVTSASARYANNNLSSEDDNTIDRRLFLGITLGGAAASFVPQSAFAAEGGDDESFASIAARASKLSSDIGEKTAATQVVSDDPRTAYDFSLPIQGDQVPFEQIIKQEKNDEGISKVKAVLVVNMKQDDPIARKDIPEFIALAAK